MGFAIGVFLAANVGRLLLLRETGDRSLQVDYALIPLAIWIARKAGFHSTARLTVGGLVAAIVISGDLLDIMARRFNWSHGVAIDYAYSMPDLPWPAIVPIIAFAMLATALCLLPFALFRHDFAIWPLGVLVGALLIGNAIRYEGSRGDVDRSRLTRSFINHAVTGTFNRLIIGRTLTPFPGATLAVHPPVSPLPPQILSVGMESFGLLRNPAQRALLLQPLRDAIGNAYSIDASFHAFEGSTLPGEIRELCGLQANGIPNTAELQARLTSSCLPARLRREGYDTQALHGNGPLMYDRRVVYPAMGFRTLWFDADLRRNRPDIRPCPGTAFAGVCDADIYARALSLFDGHRRFVHVMTLDAHLPLPDRGTTACPPVFAVDPGLCRYVQLTQASLAALGRALVAAPSRPDLVVLYGDHAPPFGATAARDRFSQHEVPYIVLRRIPNR